MDISIIRSHYSGLSDDKISTIVETSVLDLTPEGLLVLSREKFKGLFDYLNLALKKEDCNDDHALTIWFLNLIGMENVGYVVGWLIDNDGFCDCETLANVEEKFE